MFRVRFLRHLHRATTAGVTVVTLTGGPRRYPTPHAIITRNGHWFRPTDEKNFNNDSICRGCGASGHFPYILDSTGRGRTCARPATDADLIAVLSDTPPAVPEEWLTTTSSEPKVSPGYSAG